MAIYKKSLLEQFKNSQGIKTNDTESKPLLIDLATWILETRKTGENYIEFLSELEIPFYSCDCAEVGKSVFDSVVLPYDTTIITPNIEGLETLEESRIMEATFEVVGSKPVIYIPKKTDTVEMIQVPRSVITRFMTQNPYSQENIASWNNLHNQGEYDITVGVFGSIYDKDIQQKIQNLQILKQHQASELVEEYIEHNGKYYYVLASKNKGKQLVKRLTK